MPKFPTRAVVAPLALVLFAFGLAWGGYLQVQRQHSSQSVIHALMTNNHKALQEALDHGGDANATDQYGSSVGGPREQVLILLHLKQNVYSLPALTTATEIRDTAAVQLLLAHGANPNVRDSNGWTPILGMVETWQSDEDVLEYPGPHNPAPAWAVAADQKNAATCAGILSLLKAKGGNVNATTADGTTALMLAASQHKPEMVKLLLDNGADVNRALSDGETALSQVTKDAYGSSDAGTVKMLLQHGANPNVKTPNGGSPLQQASEWIDVPVVMLLLQYGADPNVRSPANDMTTLIQAARQGQYAVAKMVLDKGADPNIRFQHDDTALFEAIDGRHADVVKLLLEHGAAPNIGQNGWRTPLTAAAYQHDLPMVRLLLAHGAHVNQATTDDRTTALIEDAHHRVNRTPTDKAAQIAIADLLLAHGANPNLADKSAKTALAVARANGDGELVKLLLSHGAS